MPTRLRVDVSGVLENRSKAAVSRSLLALKLEAAEGDDSAEKGAHGEGW